MIRLNWDRYSDHRAWQQFKSLVVAKYSRFLWSVMTLMHIGKLHCTVLTTH